MQGSVGSTLVIVVLCGSEVHSLWKANCTHAGGSIAVLCHTGRVVALTLGVLCYHGDTLPSSSAFH